MKPSRCTVSLCLFLFDHTFRLLSKLMKHIVCVIGLYSSLVAATNAMPMYEYAGGAIAGISGLAVGNDIWNLTLVGSPYEDLYSSESGSLLLYDDSFALAATDALTSFIGSKVLPSPDNFFGCSYYANCNITTVTYYDMLRNNVRGYETRVDTNIAYTDSIFFSSQLDYSNVTYASWTQASVPEPSVVLLISSSLLAFWIVRLNQRLKPLAYYRK